MKKLNHTARKCLKRSLSKSLRIKTIELRRLMAADLGDTPAPAEIDVTSVITQVGEAVDFDGDVDTFKIDLRDFNLFSTRARRTVDDFSLKFRLVDETGKEVASSFTNSTGWGH